MSIDNEDASIFEVETMIENERSGEEVILTLSNADEPTVSFIEEITIRRVNN